MSQKTTPHAEPACEVINPDGEADIVLICEHASNHIPARYKNLGLPDALLRQHIAWDIGMAQLTRQLSRRLDAPAILATFSRLLIDPNREEDHPTLIPPESDAVPIPGNQGLSATEVALRKREFYHPFHDCAQALVVRKLAAGRVPLVCGMHSFTPQMAGLDRPWQAGMLWDRDPRLARALIDSLTARGYHVGDNEPYSGRKLFFTMTRHGHAHGIPHVTIEIRQDEVGDARGIDDWTDILAEDLDNIRRDRHIMTIKEFA